MNQITLLLFIHFVADFILQSDWMAINKSKRWTPLAIHVGVYALPFIPFFGLKFAAVNLAAHFVTDAVTSRASSYLWGKNQRHWFFVVIGFDQFIHTATLILTLQS